MADDGFHIRPSDLHDGAKKLEQFAADIGASGQKMKTAGDNLVEHAGRDRSGVGAVVVRSFGKALSTMGSVFSQASRLSKGSSDRLHANASAHEENETNTANSFDKLHPGSDSLPARTRGSGGSGSTELGSSGGDPHYTPPNGRPYTSGTSRNRPDDPSGTSSGLGGRDLDADPVDVVSGEVVITATDVTLAGVLPLVLRRTHVSSYRAGRSFGPTWSSTLDLRLEFDDHGALFMAEDGVILVYPHPAAGAPVLPVAGAAWPLEMAETCYRVEDPNSGVTWEFDATAALLRTVRDRNGNTIQFHRDERGVPVELQHSGGYRIAVDSADNGLVTGLRLLRPDADAVPLVQFGYDGARLVDVVNSSGLPMRFEYDLRGRVTRWVDRNGFWYRYSYREDGRCTGSTGSGGYLAATFSYDLAARVTTCTDATGATKQYEYDERGNVVRRTDALGNTEVSTWDNRSRLLSRTDPLGNTTRYDLDDNGHLTAVVYPSGTTITAEYNALGWPTRIEDAAGAVWLRRYDERGNLIQIVDPLGASTAFTYGEHGELTSVTDALGQVTTVVTNAAGLPIAVTDPAGAVVRYERDAFGRTAATLDPVGGRTSFGWTVEGQLTWRRYPDGSTEQRRYDGEGNLVEHVDAVGGRSRFGYTAFDQMIWHEQPNGARTEYGYDPALRLATVTNPVGAVWRYEYDPAGRLVGEHDFADRALRYFYDARGLYTETVNGAGEVTRLEHDSLGRLVRRTTGEQVTAMEYDQVGRLVRATTPDADLRFDYDMLGRVLAETVNGRVLTNTYDPLGRRIRRITPAGVTSDWSFDLAGNPRSLDVAGHAIGFDHDAAGRETRRRFGSVEVEQVWESTHRLRVQAISTVSAQGRPLVDRRSYQYRADGYLTGINDLTRARGLALDQAGRVIAVGDERYSYDGNGNITADSSGRYEYAAGRLRAAGRTSFRHDGNGRVLERRVRTLSGQTRTWQYTWDGEDRLRQVTTPDGTCWRYGYDAFGRRVTKTRLSDTGDIVEQVDFTWDGTVLAEQHHLTVEWSRQTSWDWQHRGNRPLTQTERTIPRNAPHDVVDREFYAIITDLVGTPTELVAESGQIVDRLDGSLWGTTARPSRVPLRFPGQYHDAESGLHYNLLRYYDPSVGRYCSEDPIGLRGGTNPSGYVPNPTAWVDPLGLAKCLAATGIGAGQTTTMSGWATPRPDGISSVDPQHIIDLENQMGFPLKNGGAFDQGTLGKYFASHAERQATYLNPNVPVRVDKPMCQDCQGFFRALAQHRQTPIVVSDPDVHRVFNPDGSVDTHPNPHGVNIGSLV